MKNPRLNSSLESDSATPAGTPRGEEFDFDMVNNSGANGQKSNWKLGRGWLVGIGLIVLYCVYTLGAISRERTLEPMKVGPFTEQGATSSTTPAAPIATLEVHVAGQVQKPGVYVLPAQSRVSDAIAKAGGVLPDANTDALNLADWLQDGQKVEVPLRTVSVPQMVPTPLAVVPEVPSRVPPPTRVQPAVVAEGTSEPAASPQQTQPTAQKTSPDYLEQLKRRPVNINTATLEELLQLPDIGEKTAGYILAYRTQHGGFQSVEELDDVKGIGPKRLEVLRQVVVVR